MNQAQQPEALRLAELCDHFDRLEPIAMELRRLHARLQELEAERATDDRVLRASVPDRWKGCTSPVGAAQSYIAELEIQQKREPLTDEQMRQVLLDTAMAAVPEDERAGVTVDEQMLEQVTLFARATELAHGIKGQTECHADDERDHSDEDAAIAAGKVQASVQRRTA